MPDEIIISGVPDNSQDAVEGNLHSFDHANFLMIEERDAHIGSAEIVVVKEEVKHLIDVRGQTPLPLFPPYSSWIIGLKLGKVSYEFSTHMGLR